MHGGESGRRDPEGGRRGVSSEGSEAGEARDPEPTHCEREHRSEAHPQIVFLFSRHFPRRLSRAHVRRKQRQIQPVRVLFISAITPARCRRPTQTSRASCTESLPTTGTPPKMSLASPPSPPTPSSMSFAHSATLPTALFFHRRKQKCSRCSSQTTPASK